MKVKAYSYIRFSTVEQLKGDSLRRQLEASEAYAEQHNLDLDSSLRDVGVSAFRGKNKTEGALKRFIDLVGGGTIKEGSVLILESLDRLSREEIMSALNLFTSILAAGIEIHTLADNQHYTKKSINDIGNLIISLVVMSRAHEESLMKSKRLSASWENKRNLAIESKKPMTKRCPKWLNLSEDRTRFIINEERADVVREMFKLSIAGLGYRLIANRLNERNYPTWGGGEFWHTSIINKMLNAPSTYGAHQPSKNRKPFGDVILGYYPAIITEDVFYQTQAAKKGRNLNGGRKGTAFSNLLTGMCKCAYCGSTMRFLNKGNKYRSAHGGKNSKYYACSKNNFNAGCLNSKKWRYDHVEDAVLAFIKHDIDWASNLSGGDSGRSELQKNITVIEAKLAAAEKRTGRLSELFLDADDDEFNDARTLYKKAMTQCSSYKKELESLNAELHGFQAPEEATQKLSSAIYKLRNITDERELYTLRAEINCLLKKPGLIFYFRDDAVHYAVNNELRILLEDGDTEAEVLARIAVITHEIRGSEIERARLQASFDAGEQVLADLQREVALMSAK